MSTPRSALSVLYTYNGSYPMNAINNSSTVLRLTTGERRVLLLGDLGVEGGRQLLAEQGAEGLRERCRPAGASRAKRCGEKRL